MICSGSSKGSGAILPSRSKAGGTGNVEDEARHNIRYVVITVSDDVSWKSQTDYTVLQAMGTILHTKTDRYDPGI